MYRYEYARLNACLPVFHQIRHIPEAIRWSGPLFVSWQFPIERLCGMIVYKIKSRSNANQNIVNVQTVIEQTNLLPFVLENVSSSERAFDRDGQLLLERVFERALRMSKRHEEFIQQAHRGEDWMRLLLEEENGDLVPEEEEDEEDPDMGMFDRNVHEPDYDVDGFKEVSNSKRLACPVSTDKIVCWCYL